jgi:hypothetical protein
MIRLSSAVDYVYVPCNNADENSDKEWLYAKSLAKQGNLYAKAVSKHKFRTFPPNHGINQTIAERLNKWAKTNSSTDRPLTALFDWDRTISCVEGISTEAFAGHIGQFTSPMMNGSAGWTTYPSKEFLDDMFVYLMRASRIPMIKDLFRELRTRGVDIRIVTNNPAASRQSPFRRIFLEMLARLYNDDKYEKKEYEFERNGSTIHVYEEYSAKNQVISAAELDAMLHSTIDYIHPSESFNKSYAVCRMNPPIDAVREIVKNSGREEEGVRGFAGEISQAERRESQRANCRREDAVNVAKAQVVPIVYIVQ